MHGANRDVERFGCLRIPQSDNRNEVEGIALIRVEVSEHRRDSSQ
jgi:hypothetical protein